jgi:hypothetical protein
MDWQYKPTLETSPCKKTGEQSLYSGKNDHNHNYFGPIAVCGDKVLCEINFSIAVFTNVVMKHIFKQVDKDVDKK